MICNETNFKSINFFILIKVNDKKMNINDKQKFL